MAAAARQDALYWKLLAETAQNDAGLVKGRYETEFEELIHTLNFVERRTDPDDSEYRLNCAGLDADQQQDETNYLKQRADADQRRPGGAGTPGCKITFDELASRMVRHVRTGLSREIRSGFDTAELSVFILELFIGMLDGLEHDLLENADPLDAARERRRRWRDSRRPLVVRAYKRFCEVTNQTVGRCCVALEPYTMAFSRKFRRCRRSCCLSMGCDPGPDYREMLLHGPDEATTTPSACPNGRGGCCAARAATARARVRARGRVRRRRRHPRRGGPMPGSRARRRPALAAGMPTAPAGQDAPRGRGARGREHRGRSTPRAAARASCTSTSSCARRCGGREQLRELREQCYKDDVKVLPHEQRPLPPTYEEKVAQLDRCGAVALVVDVVSAGSRVPPRSRTALKLGALLAEGNRHAQATLRRRIGGYRGSAGA